MAINDNIKKWLFERDQPLDASKLHDQDLFKLGSTILYEWSDEATNPTPLEVGKIEQLTTNNNTGPDPNRAIIVSPIAYRQLMNVRTYDITVDEEALQFPNLWVSSETEELIRRLQLKGESLDHCLARVLTLLDQLSDLIEGYRTEGVAL